MPTRVSRAKTRVDPVRAALERLAEAQEATQAELRHLAEGVRHLGEGMRQLAEEMRRLAESLRILTVEVTVVKDRLGTLDHRVGALDDRVGALVGSDLEHKYRDRAHTYFDDLMTDVHVLSGEEVARLLDRSVSSGTISQDDRRDARHADVILRGRRRTDNTDACLVAEVSAAINELEVARAQRRAEIIARAMGLPVIAVVAGERIRRDADGAARVARLWRLLDGITLSPSDSVPTDRLAGPQT